MYLKIGHLVPATVIKALPEHDAYLMAIANSEIMALLPKDHAGRTMRVGDCTAATVHAIKGAHVFLTQRTAVFYRRLLEMILEQLPLGPRYYPEEQITDQQLRFMAAELVREAVMMHLRQEIPYSVAVIVDQFKERSEDLTYISANILVERDTQKAIILGQGGTMIKRIGRDARRQIEELLGTRVFLELWVKVRKKWRADEQELRRLGYATPGRGG